jgi:hypothetical protein
MKHLDEIIAGVISGGRRVVGMSLHDEKWYIMTRKRRTFKLCRTRREFMIVWGLTGQDTARRRKWSLYIEHGYSSHQEACDVIKDGE